MSSLFTASSAVGMKKYPSAQGVIDANGNCEIDFPAPPVGSMWTGAATIYDSPDIAYWIFSLSGQFVDRTSGTATCAGIQMGNSDILKANATNLLQYAGQTVHATLTVIETPSDNTDLILPGHDNIVLPTQVSSMQQIYFNPALSVGIQIVDIAIPPCAVVIVALQCGVVAPLSCTFLTPDGLINYTQFQKQIGDNGYSWFQFIPVEQVLQVELSATSPPFNLVTMYVFACQAYTALNDLLVPNLTQYGAASMAATSISISTPFPLNGDSGVLTGTASLGLFQPPNGAWQAGLQWYNGNAAAWQTVALVAGSQTIPSATCDCLTPPGSGRLVVVNEGAGVQSITAGFTQ